MKTYNLQPTTYNLNKGFTLIEILIAASIFAVIVLFALSSFSLNIRGQSEQKSVGSITQAGQFVLENITREIRMAKEITEIASANFTIIDQEGKTRKYYQDGKNLRLKVTDSAGAVNDQSLLSSNLELGRVSFDGVVTAATGILQSKQPFLEIELVIQDKNFDQKKASERNRQVFRTTAVVRGFR